MNDLSTALVWASDALESIEKAITYCPDAAANSSLTLARDEIKRAISKINLQTKNTYNNGNEKNN